MWRADHVKRAENEVPNDPNFPYYHQTRIWEEDKNGDKVDSNGKKVRKVNECDAKNALVVNGNDVKIYGLFCEHTTEHQMVWNGERGSVSFFQCELPYDVDKDFEENTYVGYYVNPDVKEHIGRGIGVYSNFQVYNVVTPYGAHVPDVSTDEILIENPFTRYLNNNGGIKSVIKSGDQLYGGEVKSNDRIQRGWLGKK